MLGSAIDDCLRGRYSGSEFSPVEPKIEGPIHRIAYYSRP